MALIRRISNLFRRSRMDREIDAELSSHIDMRIEENLAAGMNADEARRDALVRFGNRTAAKERVTGMDSALMLDKIWADIRFALRQLRKNPGFAFTAIVVLTLGIGASVAIFAFVDAALIKPLPYKDPTRLVSVYETVPSCPLCNISYQNYLDWRRSDLPFSSLQAWTWESFLINTPQGTELARGARVSDGFFRLLGVTPILGRDFYAREDAPGAPHTVLLRYGAWQERFGGNRGVVGQTITMNNTSYTIIGVLPEGFHFAPIGESDFWATLNDPNACDKMRGCHGMFGLARLKDGVSLQSAIASLKTEASELARQYPDSNHDYSATATTLTDAVMGDIRPVLLVLLSGVFLLLLIACVNVSGLLLVRSESRKHETAVRAALGATPGRLFRQFLIEALMLVAMGSGLGLGFASVAMKLLIKLVPSRRIDGMPFLLTVGLNSHVLAFAAAVSLLAVAVFAITPAARTGRGNLRGDLTEGGRGTAANTWRKLGAKLIVLELATAVVLLVGAGLLGKSFYLLLHGNLGMQSEHLAIVMVNPPKTYADGDKSMVLERLIISKIGSLPGVQSVGVTSNRPVRAWDGGVPIVVPGRPTNGRRNDIPERLVSAGYLSTVGARLLHGRYFTEAEDDGDKPSLFVVNQTFAKKFFPGENPVGKHVSYEGANTQIEIVGEVEDIKEGQLDSPNQPVIYAPFNRWQFLLFNLVVRTRQNEESILPTLAAAIHEMDPAIATSDGTTMTSLITDSTAVYLHESSAWLVGGFAGIALVLSVVGLYGVIAYSVSQRTREIGVRMALGAERGSVYTLVLKEAGKLTAIGIVTGLVCSIAASMLMRSMLFGTQAWDVPTLAAVSVVLALFAMLASYIPARRAASVNPVEALRAE
ncbi:MAG: ABC transporter permease [Terracidiphilus sp.]|jgi:predicted permease